MTTIFENTVLTYIRIKITNIMIFLYLKASFIKVCVCRKFCGHCTTLTEVQDPEVFSVFQR